MTPYYDKMYGAHLYWPSGNGFLHQHQHSKIHERKKKPKNSISSFLRNIFVPHFGCFTNRKLFHKIQIPLWSLDSNNFQILQQENYKELQRFPELFVLKGGCSLLNAPVLSLLIQKSKIKSSGNWRRVYVLCIFLMKTTSLPFTKHLHKTSEKANDIESVIWFRASAPSPVTFTLVATFVRAAKQAAGAMLPNQIWRYSNRRQASKSRYCSQLLLFASTDICLWLNSFKVKSNIHLIITLLAQYKYHQNWKHQQNLWIFCHVILIPLSINLKLNLMTIQRSLLSWYRKKTEESEANSRNVGMNPGGYWYGYGYQQPQVGTLDLVLVLSFFVLVLI